MVLLDEDARDGEQPPPVVGQSQIDGATQVDVAHPASFLRQPDSAPAEHLTHDVGVLFPDLVLLVLPCDGGVRLATDIVRGLGVGGESVVINQIGRGRVRKLGVGGLEPGHQVQLCCPVQGSRHESFRSFVRVSAVAAARCAPTQYSSLLAPRSCNRLDEFVGRVR